MKKTKKQEPLRLADRDCVRLKEARANDSKCNNNAIEISQWLRNIVLKKAPRLLTRISRASSCIVRHDQHMQDVLKRRVVKIFDSSLGRKYEPNGLAESFFSFVRVVACTAETVENGEKFVGAIL